jgi:hypothetical protein
MPIDPAPRKERSKQDPFKGAKINRAQEIVARLSRLCEDRDTMARVLGISKTALDAVRRGEAGPYVLGKIFEWDSKNVLYKSDNTDIK